MLSDCNFSDHIWNILIMAHLLDHDIRGIEMCILASVKKSKLVTNAHGGEQVITGKMVLLGSKSFRESR